jgi:hypothetical protein
MSSSKVAEQIAAIKAATVKASASQKAAEQFLKRAGIITGTVTSTQSKAAKKSKY